MFIISGVNKWPIVDILLGICYNLRYIVIQRKRGNKLVTLLQRPSVGQDEELTGHTSQGVPVYVANHVADVSDLSALPGIRFLEAEILKLPPEDRNAAWNALSPVLASFSKNEASFRALEQLYSRDAIRFNGLRGVDDGGVARQWFECYSNARAVRERATLTTKLLTEAIRSAYEATHSVEVVSIASGSARCVLESVQATTDLKVRARMFDWDPEAREYCLELAQNMGISDLIEPVVGDILRVRKYLSDTAAHIVEAVGILDYLDPRQMVFVLKQLYEEVLAKGGVLVASNIMPNEESHFLHSVVRWRPMYYRTEDEFVDYFVQAGFKPEDCKIYRIPIGIYCIIYAVKA